MGAMSSVPYFRRRVWARLVAPRLATPSTEASAKLELELQHLDTKCLAMLPRSGAAADSHVSSLKSS